MKVLILKGLPGSGKSTWAKTFVAQNGNWVRVNKDAIRDMMGGYKPSKEPLVLQFRDVLIMRALDSGLNVIVDDTNLHPKHETRIRTIAKNIDLSIEVEIKFFDVPVEECIKNDLQRPVSVGEKVIKKMWREFLAPKSVEKPPYLVGVPDAIIVDIDGTVAIHTDRSPYDAAKCYTDTPNPAVAALVRLKKQEGRTILFVSGREEQWRELTVAWLTKHGIPFDQLWMRPTDDFRKDNLIKEEIYASHICGNYNVDFVLDDRDRVVQMWRGKGLTCLQVAEGDF